MVIFLLALILRISLLFSAYHGDLNNNISWGTEAVSRGLNGFYGTSSDSRNWPYSAPNQPPLTILMFAGARAVFIQTDKLLWSLNNSFQIFPSSLVWFWESRGMVLLVKLPSIIADLGIGYLIYRYFKGRKGVDLGLRLSAIWLFNPVVWYNSSVWGQTDSIVNFLGLAAILLLLNKRLIGAILAFTLSVLFKGSLAYFAPLLLFVAVRQKHGFVVWLKSLIVALLALLVSSIWFHPEADLLSWLPNLYTSRIFPGEIGYLTASGFNFWWLVNPGKVSDSTTYLGVPARILGFVPLAISLLLSGIALYKKMTDKRVFIIFCLVAFVAFEFMTRIHGRYLYPFFPMATILLGLVPVLAIPYILLSLVHWLNLYYGFWAPPFHFLESLYLNPMFMNMIAVSGLVLFVIVLYNLAKIIYKDA